MKRSQSNDEKIDALLSVLVSEGVLTSTEAKHIRRTSEFGEAKQLGKGLAERRK